MPVDQLPGVNGGIVYHDGRGHIFRRQREFRGIIYMVCALSTCPSRANMLVDGDHIEVTKPHNHDPDFDLPAALVWRRRILERCRTETGSVRKIYREEIARAGHLANHEVLCNMYSSLQRAKAAMAPPTPPIPDNLRDFKKLVEKPEYARFSKTLNGEPWLLDVVSSGHGDSTAIFLFPTARNLLKECEVFHISGTFKLVPQSPPCVQLTTITAMVGDTGFLVVLALMSQCSRMAYVTMLRRVLQEEPNWIPDLITADFENILQSALDEVFGTTGLTTIIGCWYQYTQDLWRKLGSWLEDSTSHQAARMAMALPVLPASSIHAGLKEMVSLVMETLQGDELEQMLEFLQYVDENWIGRCGGEKLSVHELEDKLSYDIETLHHRIAVYVTNMKDSGHPRFWDFMSGLQKLEDAQHKILKTLLEKDKISKSRKKRHYQTQNKQMYEFCVQLNRGALSVKEFLALIAPKVYKPSLWDGQEKDGAEHEEEEEEEEEGEIVGEFEDEMENSAENTIEEILLDDDDEVPVSKEEVPMSKEEPNKVVPMSKEVCNEEVPTVGEQPEVVIGDDDEFETFQEDCNETPMSEEECIDEFEIFSEEYIHEEVAVAKEENNHEGVLVPRKVCNDEFETFQEEANEEVPMSKEEVPTVVDQPEVVIDAEGEYENNEECYYVVVIEND